MDKTILARVKKQAWFHRYPRGVPTLLFLLTCLATALAVLAIERSDSNTRRMALEHNANELAGSLEQRAAENIAYLSAGASLFTFIDNMSPAAFAQFTAELNESHAERGALGMGWARYQAADTNGKAAAVPIIYLEPRTPENRKAIGYDMYSEPVRREALDRAVANMNPAVSGKVQLVQDANNESAAGFLIYVPVVETQGGQDIVTGFVYSPIRAREFLGSATRLLPNAQFDAEIFDSSVGPENLLASLSLPGREGSHIFVPVNIGDHAWVLRVADRKPDGLGALSLLAILCGIMLATMLTIIARMITKRAAEDRVVLEWLSDQTAIRTSLTRELNHRVKNTLANVLSIVSLTRSRASNIDEFADGLTGRIRALSATHDLLSESDWTDAAVRDIVLSEVSPYVQDLDDHITIDGPDIHLAPNHALSLGLAIHELVTNAAKYGSLSQSGGRVAISWKPVNDDVLEFNWRESGGPAVVKPARRGFGLELLERIVAHELGTNVAMDFQPSGLVSSLQVPIRTIGPFALKDSQRGK